MLSLQVEVEDIQASDNDITRVVRPNKGQHTVNQLGKGERSHRVAERSEGPLHG